jgi:hypothetical protein
MDHAFEFQREGSRFVQMEGSVMDWLKIRGVEWLISRRSCDLSLHSANSALDVSSLAQTLMLREKEQVGMVTLAMKSIEATTMRHMNR